MDTVYVAGLQIKREDTEVAEDVDFSFPVNGVLIKEEDEIDIKQEESDDPFFEQVSDERMDGKSPERVLTRTINEKVRRAFTCDVIFSLLEKVRKEEVLWNTKHRCFHKKTLKRSLFEKICAELKSEYPQLLDLTTADVMDKFKYVRGQYQKILRKIRNAPSGSAAETPKKWEYFKACSFMQSLYDGYPTQSSFIHPDDLEPPKKEENLEDEVEITISPTSSTPSPLPDINEIIEETCSDSSNSQSSTSSGDGSPVARKRNKAGSLDDKMSKTIDNLEKAWAEQAKKQSSHEMATEIVASAMKYFATEEQIKLKLTMDIMDLVAATMRAYGKSKISEL